MIMTAERRAPKPSKFINGVTHSGAHDFWRLYGCIHTETLPVLHTNIHYSIAYYEFIRSRAFAKV